MRAALRLLEHEGLVPGTVVPNADRIARVSVKLSATVAELRKRLGDTVAPRVGDRDSSTHQAAGVGFVAASSTK